MKVESLKELKRLIQLCQSQGVRSITVDGISLELNEIFTQPKQKRSKKEVSETVNFPPNVDESIQIPQMAIETDELSPEEMLFYSAPSEAQQ